MFLYEYFRYLLRINRMKGIGHIIFYFIIVIGTLSFTDANKTEQLNNSVVIVKLKYNSYGCTGYGGKLIIKNVVTNIRYQSKVKMGFNSFVMITSVPNGTYVVEALQIITGCNTLMLRDESYFNEIIIDEAKIYYLGNYFTEKIPPLFELHFESSKRENDEEAKIYKQVKKDSETWLQLKIDFTEHLFTTETTTIELKN